MSHGHTGAGHVADARPRQGTTSTVAELAAGEALIGLPPMPYPAVIAETRLVADNALVHWDGNSYSTPPGLIGVTVTVRRRVGTDSIDIVTPAGTVAAPTCSPLPGRAG